MALPQAPRSAWPSSLVAAPRTQPCAGREVQHPGTYLGVAERAPHIRAVGANAVVITPCYATAKGEGGRMRAH